MNFFAQLWAKQITKYIAAALAAFIGGVVAAKVYHRHEVTLGKGQIRRRKLTKKQIARAAKMEKKYIEQMERAEAKEAEKEEKAKEKKLEAKEKKAA